ncbi:MAG: hypothetical protein Q8Q31_04780 [Nanoarchaeota archaeon]|nr:hypothetical protein [Nanoarchaeota archaeon]
MVAHKEMVKALVQNQGFKRTDFDKLPTIDFVYPDFTADGLTEEFRFERGLRRQLAERTDLVRDKLRNKEIVWTSDEKVLLEVHPITPRLRLEEQINGNVNTIYNYAPMLFAGFDKSDFGVYVVKPIVNESMAWFELTTDEKIATYGLLMKKAEDRPYRTWTQRLFGGRK